ncbi:MAG: D-ribose pyranase [Mycobacteriales bacterium]
MGHAVKRGGLLHPQLLQVVGSMGHLDELIVCDAGFPIPPNVDRVDLAYRPGAPSFADVLEVLAGELVVEAFVTASEAGPLVSKQVEALFPNARGEQLTHDELKRRSTRARAVVRTGECTPYANVVLISGVDFPSQP